MNIYQNAQSVVDFQLLDSSGTPKDLSKITKVFLDIAIKETRKKILSVVGSISSALNGQISFTIDGNILSTYTPEELNVPKSMIYKPTSTLYGYISMIGDNNIVVDKIFIDDISIYFDME